MYAVVEIAGKQYKVVPEQKVAIPTIAEKEGTSLTIERVLLLGSDSGVKVGTPLVKGASVKATVLGPVRAEEVSVFKKKKRKGYRLRRGHRQKYTQIQITSIA
jgi:large subunit ribosomal protein L21